MKKFTFVCEPVRKRDAQGKLVSAGVKWREGTALNRGRAFLGAMLLVGSLLMHWFCQIPGMGVFEVVTVGLVIWGSAMILWPAADREMHFGNDWITTPGGTKYHRDERWGYKASQVESIEATLPLIPDKDQFRHDVIVMMDDGNVIHVAGDLHPEDALIVARALTKARLAIGDLQGASNYGVYLS